MDVGVRELKQRLSFYLTRVARGETIRVTDRGVLKAVLAPPSAQCDLTQGFAEGWIARGVKKRRQPAAPAPSNVSISSVLAEDRDA